MTVIWNGSSRQSLTGPWPFQRQTGYASDVRAVKVIEPTHARVRKWCRACQRTAFGPVVRGWFRCTQCREAR